MGPPHYSRLPTAEPFFGLPMTDRDWRTPCKAMGIAGT